VTDETVQQGIIKHVYGPSENTLEKLDYGSTRRQCVLLPVTVMAVSAKEVAIQKPGVKLHAPQATGHFRREPPVIGEGTWPVPRAWRATTRHPGCT
jgi:hypothetical protein